MLGEEIRKSRLKAGLTQEELAFRSGISRNYVSLLELNEKSPTIDILIRLCRAMGASAGRDRCPRGEIAGIAGHGGCLPPQKPLLRGQPFSLTFCQQIQIAPIDLGALASNTLTGYPGGLQQVARRVGINGQARAWHPQRSPQKLSLPATPPPGYWKTILPN